MGRCVRLRFSDGGKRHGADVWGQMSCRSICLSYARRVILEEITAVEGGGEGLVIARADHPSRSSAGLL